MIRGRVHILVLLFSLTFSQTLLPFLSFFSDFKQDFVAHFSCLKGISSVKPLHSSDASLDPVQGNAACLDGNYCNQLKLTQHDCLSLPLALRDLKNYAFCSLPSELQKGPSCGWYQIFNAKAIQTLVQRQEPFTAAAIRSYVVNQLIPFVKDNADVFKAQFNADTFKGLTWKEKRQLASYIGVTNHYDVAMDMIEETKEDIVFVSKDRFPELAYQIAVPDLGKNLYLVPNDNIPLFLKIIKEKPEPIVHILLSVPTDLEHTKHAVLLTIIKRENQKPLLLYLNSTNAALDLSSVVRWAAPGAHISNQYIIKFIQALDNA